MRELRLVWGEVSAELDWGAIVTAMFRNSAPIYSGRLDEVHRPSADARA